MAIWRVSSAWTRYFAQAAAALAAAPQPPRPPAPPALSREALEVAWLVCCLPPKMRAALAPDLLALKRSRLFNEPLPVAAYTWPEMSVVRRPRYLKCVLRVKTQAKLCARLRDEVRVGVAALCAPESELSRPMRNALLVMQGRRLAQVSEMLARWLEPEEVLRLVQQEVAAQR